jgi:hypothetical protein
MLSCLTAGILLVGLAANAQIVVDWPTKTLVSYPPVLDQTMNVTVTVNNVNDLLYSYSIKVTQAPNSLNDASNFALQAANNAKAGLPVGDCAGQAAALNAAVSSISQAMVTVFDGSSKKDATGKLRSVSLAETISAWNSQVKNPWTQNVLGPAAIEGTIAAVQAACKGDPAGDGPIANGQQLGALIAAKQSAVDGPHQIIQTTQLSPDNADTIAINEACNGTQTAQFTANFTPQSNVLTLSLGTLVSEIQQRTYSNSKDPTNTQQNLLSAGGTGLFTPLGVALLNYQLPWNWADGKNLGLTISSGLVLRLGASTVTSSSLGWFGGPSIHLFHRLFISAGVHVGQFTDFPAGMHVGSVVPANYGDLTGVNRSTARFAFGVTYQTKQFSTGSTAPTTSSTGSGND